MNNRLARAALLMRAAEQTSRDDLREKLIDAAIVLAGESAMTYGVRLDSVMDSIVEALADGPKAVKELDSEMRELGASEATLKRAKAKLNKEGLVHEWSEGIGMSHIWYIESTIMKDEAEI